MGGAHELLRRPTTAVTERRSASPYTFDRLLVRYSFGTTVVAGITSCFVFARRARRTRVDHLGALNRYFRALPDIGADSISVIRGKDRALRTRASRGRAEACQSKEQREGVSQRIRWEHLVYSFAGWRFLVGRAARGLGKRRAYSPRHPISHIGWSRSLPARGLGVLGWSEQKFG